MRRVFLTGHRSFANHGCEALVRSAVALFGEALGEVEFLVPSADPEEDAGFWPQAAERGVRFVAPVDAPRLYVWWARACRRLSAWRRLPWPPFPIGADLCRHLEATDLLIATGGDNYTLDYGLDSLSGMIGIDGRAMDLGIPAVLWGASVGPFDAVPEVVPRVRRHLARFGLIVARETVTRDYLATMGLAERMRLSADPAFVMAPEPFDLQGIMPAVGGAGTIALNLSPLIRRYHASHRPGVDLEEEMAAFVTVLVEVRGFSVILVPHVVGTSGSDAKCDHAYLKRLFARTGDAGGRIALAPRDLNAPRLKHLLANCRFVLAARTHATIGALSSGIPTVSIAYSTKARGINRDLFGSERYVLDGVMLGRDSLDAHVSRLVAEEEAIRRVLATQRPQWALQLRAAATAAVDLLATPRPHAKGAGPLVTGPART